MSSTASFDPVWDTIYKNRRHANKYPWSSIVTFVNRFRPRNKKDSDVHILEVGCGTGANLWFAAREGFRVSGVDASKYAIDMAKERFEADALEGDFRVEDFTSLSFPDNSFDLVLDRAALSCCGKEAFTKALQEIERVLVPNGKLFFTPYANTHSDAIHMTGTPEQVKENLHKMTILKDVGQISFYSEDAVQSLFVHPWKLLSMKRVHSTETIGPQKGMLHSELQVVAELEKNWKCS